MNEIVRNHLAELVKTPIDPQESLKRLDELLAKGHYRGPCKACFVNPFVG